MRPLLIAVFGSIITVPAVAIITNGVVAIALWLISMVVTIDFAGAFGMVFWWANAAAVIGTAPIFRHILVMERQQPA